MKSQVKHVANIFQDCSQSSIHDGENNEMVSFISREQKRQNALENDQMTLKNDNTYM